MSPFITLPSGQQNALFPGRQHSTCNDTAELEAIRFVRSLGIRSHLKGYCYLITAIVLGKTKPELLGSLTRSLYPAVAELYRTTPSAVERNIRSAVQSAAAHDPERMQSVFYYKTGKPYISEVLALALDSSRPM